MCNKFNISLPQSHRLSSLAPPPQYCNMIIEWSSQMSHPHHDRRHVHHLDHLGKDHLFLILLSSNSAWALLMALLSSAISFLSSASSSLKKMKRVINTYSFLLSSISSSLQQKAEYSYTGHKLHNMTMDLGIGCSALFSVCSSGSPSSSSPPSLPSPSTPSMPNCPIMLTILVLTIFTNHQQTSPSTPPSSSFLTW